GRSAEIQAKKPLTRKLVGFTLASESDPCPEECHLVLKGEEIVGRVTSAVRSPSLNKIVGLAYVHPSDGEPGKQFDIKVEGGRRHPGCGDEAPVQGPEQQAAGEGSMASLPDLVPATLKRRSFIYRKLAAAGAEFAEVNGGAVAMRYPARAENETTTARRMALA